MEKGFAVTACGEGVGALGLCLVGYREQWYVFVWSMCFEEFRRCKVGASGGALCLCLVGAGIKEASG